MSVNTYGGNIVQLKATTKLPWTQDRNILHMMSYGYDPGGKCYARKGGVHVWLDSHLKTADPVTSLPCSGFPQLSKMQLHIHV